ncbi:putative bifunctional diguanylate cyclase/phosphodiesterase [Demequina mangrovi]|uniref:Diguanylate cyclase (GGDEF) domain-containing protein n=1 Tax=Demequina mangrovi TaxID=1043493 RepID=A0A1H7AFL8_9MICO|nr:bifunctional diguanylate cyclase/phosphodiesterase [Demequina mangrovi]SEJ59795.1 diguanylate cyclase (GGDEF) domain-containing protein [Demequina mangrovi]
MELTASRTGGARTPFLAPPALDAYVTGVTTLGALGLAAVLVGAPWGAIVDSPMRWQVLVLACAAIIGEVRPIRLVDGGSGTRTLSTSAPFVLALVGVAGVGVAVVAQLVASGVDDVVQRRPLRKSLFNLAQYALSVIAARAVYAGLTGAPFFGGPSTVEMSEIAALLIAGVAMVAVNWLLVACVVSLSVRGSITTVLRMELRDFVVVNLVLLSVGSLAAEVGSESLLGLALLAGPVLAAHVFASAAARHAHDATHDLLTGLGNRAQLQRDLSRALGQASESSGPGLVLLDLDHFKDFNDTLGHPVGDMILRQVAHRLVAAAPEGSRAHRLGGDEFAVVVDGGLAESRRAARDMLASFEAPVNIDGLELLVRASVGVAVAPMHGTDGAELLKHADIALYHAKLERDRISTFAPEFDINTVDRLQLLADLRTALSETALHVEYQPQVDLASGRTVGVEALVRWHHPERGLVRPDEFVPLAENSGLILELTTFVLDQALRDLAAWRARGHEVRMAVNLSARHLSDLALPRLVAEAIERHGVPATSLVLEVTETGILSDPIRADLVIRELRQLGVAIAIDDYGTGNASLNYLRRLQIDELKIDRSFVSNIQADDHDLIIVRSTIELALALGLRVVAEGVEDAPTAVALAELGPVIAQGFHLGRPAPAATVLQALEGSTLTPAERG